MKPFRHILCPVDFSTFSTDAFLLAVQLARNFDATLEVVHVLDVALPLPGLPLPAADLVADARRRAEEGLAALRARDPQGAARFEIDEGRAWKVLLGRIERHGADLLVMGTHGLSGYERLLLGSTTEKLLHHASIPLLTVSARAAARGGSGAPGPPFRTILAATELAPGSDPAVDGGVALARRFGARLVLLHALALPHSPLLVEGAPWLSEAEIEKLAERLRPERMARLAARVGGGEPLVGECTHLVREGHPAAVILSAAEEVKADLIVIGAHGRPRSGLGWIGSICQQVIRSATSPVLVMRELV